MTGKTISQRLAELEVRKKTLQFRLSRQERTIGTCRKLPIGALVQHRLENAGYASLSRPFLDWRRCEIPKYPVRKGDRDLFDDLLKPGGGDQVSNDEGTAS